MTTNDAHRSVDLVRTQPGRYRARNPRGGTLDFGSGGDQAFTPVELLLAAIAGCSAVDVDTLTSRRAEPTEFAVTAGGDKLRDDRGNHLGPVEVTFTVRFPEGERGDAARRVLPDAIRQSHDRLCTVSRTVMLPTDVTLTQD